MWKDVKRQKYKYLCIEVIGECYLLEQASEENLSNFSN